MDELVLYHHELDENCYRVRLLLSLLHTDCRRIAVDAVPGRPLRDEALLAEDPAAALPLLRHGGALLVGSPAILVYLASRFDRSRTWLPQEPVALAAVIRWMDHAASTLAPATRARTDALFAAGADPADRQAARLALRQLDDHLARRQLEGFDFVVGPDPTLADIALFPSFALSRDYGLDHEEFAALRQWQRRVRLLEGFITMPGIPDYH